MSAFDIQITPCGSEQHLADLRQYRAMGVPVPHDYSSWPLRDSTGTWLWCRAVDPGGNLIVAYPLHMFPSGALPGTRFARVERIGRQVHAAVADNIGALLSATAAVIPRLERLDVRVFDEDRARQSRIGRSILASGGYLVRPSRNYTQTLFLDLGGAESEVLARMSYSARRNIRRCQECSALAFRPLTDPLYLNRLRQLLVDVFGPSGVHPPEANFSDVLRDSSEASQSLLVGAFLADRHPPDDLVGFMWGRLHGDHAVYELGGSERVPELGSIAVGYGIVWELCRWARRSGAAWLDLGGVTPGSASHPRSTDGASLFKRHFSRDERAVAAEYRFEPRPLLAKLANSSRWLTKRTGLRR